MIKAGFVAIILGAFFGFGLQHVGAQELVLDEETIAKAKVLEILSKETRTIPGTTTLAPFQTIRAEILEGLEKGKIITVENDYLELNPKDTFYVLHRISTFDGVDTYSVSEGYRLTGIYILVGVFLFVLLLFGGLQGLRGLAALIGSFLLIFYVLLPQLLAGVSPILLSVGVSSLVVILGSYITHGFNKTTTAAVLGMISTLVLTGILAYYAVILTKLSGFSSDESVYLNFATHGLLNLQGILLGGILIGLLGVLYDAAIGQAISVEELWRANLGLSRSKVYTRALRIGREHVGALVNTLAIAYVGASLPLLLLFYNTDAPVSQVLNREIFAVELVRTLVGSIGLILAVPLTTLVAVLMLRHSGKGLLKEKEAGHDRYTHKH